MTDTTASAGATPAAGGATPPQSPPAQPASGSTTAAPTEPAKGEDDALGEKGLRALQVERDAAKAAKAERDALQKQLDELKASTLSDSDKAIAQAKKDGSTETLTRVQAQIRRSEVKAALVGAGINASVLDLAINASEFTALKVDDEGVVDGLEAAVTAFKAGRKDLFGTAAAGGSSDGGARGAPRLTKEQVTAWSKDPAEYDKHRDEIMAWQAAGMR